MKDQKAIILLILLVAGLLVGFSSIHMAIVAGDFDTCDNVGNWVVIQNKAGDHQGNNTLVVDTTDKVEGMGSLKGTLASTGPTWGGMFYKRPQTGFWDFTENPLLKMNLKLGRSLGSSEDLIFALVTGPNYEWNGFSYEIVDKLVVGQWITVSIDLRVPDSSPEGKTPDLATGTQISFNSWSAITTPLSINWDNITAHSGPIIPPQLSLTVSTTTILIGESAEFQAKIIGGASPYTYEWYVGTQKQTSTSSTFTFTSNQAGKYTIKCVVMDSEEQTAEATATVTVLSAPPPSPSIPEGVDTLKSEVRGMFLHMWWSDPALNWDDIAETCVNFRVNTIVMEIYKGHIWQNGKVKDYPELREAISSFHSKGLKVHVLLCVGLGSISGMETLTSSGSSNWLDFSNPSSREALKGLTEGLVKNYEIDGFMFDYIRWDFGLDRPLGEEAKTKFIADTGLSDVNWYNDVLEGGKYHWNFLQWRTIPVSEAVRDMTQTMLAIKPDLVISSAVFTAFDKCGNYWVTRIGQHTADWVDKGYMDFISPMLYSSDGTTNRANLEDSLNFFTGGPEGKIPVIPFIIMMDPTTATPYSAEAVVETVKQMKLGGADGWILFCYGGPGLLYGDLVDNRPYLTALYDAGLMEDVWAIQNLKTQMNKEETQAVVSWNTTVQTKAKVEYADVNLFVGENRTGDFGRPIVYKDINYVSGTVKEDSTFSTFHSFTIPITSDPIFHVQSTDEGGVAVTSKPMSILEASSSVISPDTPTTTEDGTAPSEPIIPQLPEINFPDGFKEGQTIMIIPLILGVVLAVWYLGRKKKYA